MDHKIRRTIYSVVARLGIMTLPFSLPIVIIFAGYADYKGWKAEDVL